MTTATLHMSNGDTQPTLHTKRSRPAPNVLENPPIILSSSSQKIAYYSFLIPIRCLLFLYYSFFLYSCRLLLKTMETIPTSCQLKMKHVIIFIIIIIIIWVIFEIDSLKFTKITSRSIARTWPSTIVDNIKINTERTLIEQSYQDTLIKQSDRLFLWVSNYSKIIPVAIVLF